MSYGITDTGFVIKRLDVIREEIHRDLTNGFGYDTRVLKPSYLDTLVTTFATQIATLWETAQDSYYAKFPYTAEGINLDNAVQYGGVKRVEAKKNVYNLHCLGVEDYTILANTKVSTSSEPVIGLVSVKDFTITKDSFNEVYIRVDSLGDTYSLTIDDKTFSTDAQSGDTKATVLNRLLEAITHDGYNKSIVNRKNEQMILLSNIDESGVASLELSDTLKTSGVVNIIEFETEDYGKITLPNGTVNKIVNASVNFESVTNKLPPIYGRLAETDSELRTSYVQRSMLRSSNMIGSITSEIIDSVDGVETATGYENVTNETVGGMPPHSIEIIVEGGDDYSIANAILKKKAAGIATYGNISQPIAITTEFGDTVEIRFSRPQKLYAWFKVLLYGNTSLIPQNYDDLTKKSIIKDTSNLKAGDTLYVQLLNESLYDIANVVFTDIKVAYSTDASSKPSDESFVTQNISATNRQIVVVAEDRIEVTKSASD